MQKENWNAVTSTYFNSQASPRKPKQKIRQPVQLLPHQEHQLNHLQPRPLHQFHRLQGPDHLRRQQLVPQTLLLPQKLNRQRLNFRQDQPPRL